jgi:allantoicase
MLTGQRAPVQCPPEFTWLPDVASRALGASVLAANDDFFADARNLLSPEAARHDPGAFGHRGKVYDGWETRRRRTPGADHVIVRLAVPAILRGVNIDTSFFTGNYPSAATVDATTLLGYLSAQEVAAADWTALAPRADLVGDSPNYVSADAADQLATHVRLTIHPDGGVARLRVHGEIVPDPRFLGGRPDLAALTAGAQVHDCSNMFYSSPANALSPGRAQIMADGWETARRRDDGHDWMIVRLAAPGELHEVIIDTSCFLGNAPGWAALSDAETGAILLPRTRLLPDTAHRLRLAPAAAARLVRLDIYPDGGIARLRLRGTVPATARPGIAGRWIGLLPPALAASVDSSEFFA